MSAAGRVPLEALLLSEDAEKQAFEAKLAIEKFVEMTEKRSLAVRLDANDISGGSVVSLPPPAVDALVKTLGYMADGSGVLVMPIQPEVSTQEAADFLHVSRPHLVRMLERGELPYRRVGRRRRIKFKDLLIYRERRTAEHHEVLDDLTAAGVFGGPSR
jgi:excisionase family DNA binding protein